jgi:predicted transcriptional regulator
MDGKKKPTLLRLRQKTSITTQQLALEAGVSLAQAYVVEIGGFVDREIAEKVISAFSQLSGTHCTLNDIRLQNVSPPASSKSGISDLPTTKHTITRQKS